MAVALADLSSRLRSQLACRRFARQKETAFCTRQSKHGDFGRIATGSGDRAGQRGENSADAQSIWRIQERRRFAGNQRHRPQAFGKNAQVPGRWKGRATEKCACAADEAGRRSLESSSSSGRYTRPPSAGTPILRTCELALHVSIPPRYHRYARTLGEWVWVQRCGVGLGRRW